jgi:DNA-binding CsgD family transcriptional regulator
VGKTSLLHALRERAGADVQWLWGACEPLLAPAAYLPLVDMLDQLPPGLGHAVRSGRGGLDLLAGFLSLLRDRNQPTVLVFDDVQWADGATLELLRYLARRIEGTRAVLALAHRTDLPREHALHGLLGAVPAGGTLRLALQPLSEPSVALLAQQAGRPARGLFAATRGNPFYVTEWLAAPAGDMPAAVRDAVLARAALLSEPARELLALVCVAPAGLEEAVIDAVLDDVAAALDACAQGQLLHREGTVWRFRHDIARQACESALSHERRISMHAAVFDALDMLQASPARRVHHAERAGLWPAVARLAPLAAYEAAQAGAQRQAADLLALAVAHTLDETAARRAELLDRLATAQRACNRLAEAVASREAALALLRPGGDELALGCQLRELARLHWMAGRLPEGRSVAQQAVASLQQAGVAHELALAHDVLALLWVIDDPQAALHWGRLALQDLDALAHPLGRAHALATVGFTELVLHDSADGWSHLEEGLALALKRDDRDSASRAWSNMASMSCMHRQWQRLASACAAGLSYAQARDMDFSESLLRVRLAWSHIEQGRWPAARAELQQVRAMPGLAPLQDRQSRHLLALLNLREGVDDEPRSTAAYWRGQIDGSTRMVVDPWYAPQAAAAAEAAWLWGDREAMLQVVDQALPHALRAGERWRIGQLLCWRHRAGAVVDAAPPGLPEPCALELQGRPDAAAAAWAALGCRYAQALALAAAGQAQAAQGLALLAELGAHGALRALRPRLQAGGQRELPRGPNRRTRDDPLGLTGRERQILDLLAQGLGNRDIAVRLSRSERTVEHHVSALLAKLGAGTRAEAVRLSADAAEAVARQRAAE